MTESLKRTPLYDAHVALGAKMVDFAGFEMPVKYTSESTEHLATRTNVGVFDVSHMGEVWIEGARATACVARLVTNDPTKIVDGQAMYAGMLNEDGGFVDDVIVYKYHANKYLVVVNAGNRAKDFAHMQAVVAREFADVSLVDAGNDWSQIAVQGPKAAALVAQMVVGGVEDIRGYHFALRPVQLATGERIGVDDVIVARTGYTGEDGFELYVKNRFARAVWDAVLALGGVPCGLACRDTLRLEAGMCLYGNDIDEQHSPLEANLGWIVKGTGFVGHEVLAEQKRAGTQRLLRGLVMVDRGIARHGYVVKTSDGSPIGDVTSGTQAPFVKEAIAMAYVQRAHAEPGSEVYVEVRGKLLKARVVKLPFYKRPA